MQLSLTFDSPALRFCILGSGSSGNSIAVELGGRSLLVDAGFSCREMEHRLDYVGLAPDSIDGLVLTHEHGDHARGAARFSRRYQVPIHATAGTLEGVRLSRFAPPPRPVRPGRPQRVGPFQLEPFPVSHDAREPIGMVVVSEAGHRLGLAADLGTRTGEAWDRLRDLDAFVLETNHDLEMLMRGPYPWHLKRRIASDTGHLSNAEAAAGIRELVTERLAWLVLYHLSRVNNRRAIAEEIVGEELERSGSDARICVSDQFAPTPWMAVAAPLGASPSSAAR